MSESNSNSGPRGEAQRRRRWVVNLLKIALGVAMMVFIATRLRIDDMVLVERQGAEPHVETGRDLEIDGVWVVEPLEGPPYEVPRAEHPFLEIKDGRSRVRRQGREPEEVRRMFLRGKVTLRQEAGTREIPLESLHYKPGATENGWTERLPAIEEGLATIYGRLSVSRYTIALLLVFCMYGIGAIRWWILLRAQGLTVGLWRAVQLTYIGYFFNNVVPGLTGGDVVKAVMIARDHPGKGARAVSTVIADRVIGIIVLAVMSTAVLAFSFSRYQEAAIGIFLFLGIVALSVVLFFSRRVRRGLRINNVLQKLPGAGVLQRLDESFLHYRSQKGAVCWALLLSLANHSCSLVFIFLLGMDLGVDRGAGLQGEPLVTYLATVPIVLIVSSVPLLPGGWGLGELMYGYFFRTVGVRNLSLSVGLSVLSRATMLLWSLLGGIFYMFHRREAQEALHEAQEHPESLIEPSDADGGAPEGSA